MVISVEKHAKNAGYIKYASKFAYEEEVLISPFSPVKILGIEP
jgi:hypothetical protein